MKIEAATAWWSVGSDSMPMTEWCFLEKSEPRTDNITIAKHDMTVQLQALKADTTGFMVGELQ